MEPVMNPVTSMAGAGSSPKSPRQNISPSVRNSPAADRWPSATSSNEFIASPKQDCAICLGKLKNECFTDLCLHKFCFSCLVKWSKDKPECPLCQQSFKYIIQNVHSIEDYDEYHLQTETENPDPWNSMLRETWIEEVLQWSPS